MSADIRPANSTVRDISNQASADALTAFFDHRDMFQFRHIPVLSFIQCPGGTGALAHCRRWLHTSLLEGINNKIKVPKRRVCGYRDDEYFFLKIRQTFP